jgi:hypothetical protein
MESTGSIEERARRTPDAGSRPPHERAFWTVFATVLVLHLLAVNVTPILPWVDIPFHMAAAQIRATWDDPASLWGEYVSLRPLGLRPNLLYHLWAGSGIAGDVVTATRVFYSIYVVAIPLLSLAVVRTLNGSPWIALLAFLLVFNFNVTYGFAEFTAGLPFFLLLVLLLVHWDRTAGWWHAPAVGGALAVLFFGHALLAIFGLLTVVLFAVLKRGRQSWAALAACVPLVVLLATWYTGRGDGESGIAYLWQYYTDGYWRGLWKRMHWSVRLDNRPLIEPLISSFLAAGFVAVVLVTLAGVMWSRLRAQSDPVSKRVRVLFRLPGFAGIGALLLAAGATVAFAPPGYPPFWNVFQRFMCLLVLALVFWAAALAGRRWFHPKAACLLAGIALLHGSLWLEHTLSYRDQLAPLTRLFAAVPAEAIPGIFAADQKYRGDGEVFAHVSNLFIVLHGRMAVSPLFDYPYTHVPRQADPAVLPPYDGIHDDGAAVFLQSPLKYVIVRETDEHGAGDRFHAAFRPLSRSGGWTLYRRAAATRETTRPIGGAGAD